MLRETAQAPQQYTVTAERLSVRVAPSGDASVLRKVGRGAIVSVISSSHDAARDEEWFELGMVESVGGAQLLQGGGGWVLAGAGAAGSVGSPRGRKFTSNLLLLVIDGPLFDRCL